jgi:hypothetical protein
MTTQRTAPPRPPSHKRMRPSRKEIRVGGLRRQPPKPPGSPQKGSPGPKTLHAQVPIQFGPPRQHCDGPCPSGLSLSEDRRPPDAPCPPGDGGYLDDPNKIRLCQADQNGFAGHDPRSFPGAPGRVASRSRVALLGRTETGLRQPNFDSRCIGQDGGGGKSTGRWARRSRLVCGGACRGARRWRASGGSGAWRRSWDLPARRVGAAGGEVRRNGPDTFFRALSSGDVALCRPAPQPAHSAHAANMAETGRGSIL